METPLNINVVALHFHYPQSWHGRIVQLTQLLKGMRYWQFSHLSLSLSNGLTIEQNLGRTTIAYSAQHDHKGITIPLVTALSNERITYNAYDNYLVSGEFSPTNNCTLMVSRSLSLNDYAYPAQLFNYCLQHSLDSQWDAITTPYHPTASDGADD